MNPKMTATDAARFFGISLQSVHKKLRSKNLQSSKTQNRVYFGHETSRVIFPRPKKCLTVAFQIVKGGTGKTSIAHSVAVRASLYGLRVLMIDLDQQGNLSQACGLDPETLPCMVDILNQEATLEESLVTILPGLDLLPSRIENAILDSVIMLNRLPLDRVYKDRIKKIKGNYDLIIIDCPPAIGQSVAAATLAADLVVAPVAPEKFCLSGLEITAREVKNLEQTYKKKIPLRIVLNKYDTRIRLSNDVLTSLLKHPIYGEIMFRSYLRISQEFPNSIAKNQSVFDTVKDTVPKEDADLLTREIAGLVASAVHKKADSHLSKSGKSRTINSSVSV